MPEKFEKTVFTDAAVEKAKQSVHELMKARVALARNGCLLKEVDEHLVQGAAKLGALVLGYDIAQGIPFMLEIGNIYSPLLKEAGQLAQEELLALEAEEFANRPQDQ